MASLSVARAFAAAAQVTYNNQNVFAVSGKCFTILPLYHFTILPFYHFTILPFYHLMWSFSQEKKEGFVLGDLISNLTFLK
jgi:hypothetical protein